jgi:hypothetical protein
MHVAEMGAEGMPGGMQHPLRHSLMTVFLLPQMQSELGLSAQQSSQLGEFKRELIAKGKEYGTQIGSKQKELDALITPDTSKGMKVKALLEEIGKLRADQQFAAYEAERKMKGALTDDQRSKLAAMKPAERMQVMMSHMTMGDMMEMMRLMGGGGGIMSGGMGMMEMMSGG